jgi:hypothetical protein
MGEHDYYLDLGEYWSKLFGPQHYSWEHKGVHFITLNSILTFDDWTHNRWPSDEQRMLEMAGLDNPNGSPFMVGDAQRKWLKDDLKKVKKDTPIVLFSHSPIQKIAVRRRHRGLRARSPDPVQPDRQHQLSRRDGHRLAVAVPAELRAGQKPFSQADGTHEPCRSVPRA